MKTNVLNYRVHIEQEAVGKKTVYNAFCPTLGLADYGKTIDEALKHITDLITFHIETLSELNRPISADRDSTTVITSIRVPYSGSLHATL